MWLANRVAGHASLDIPINHRPCQTTCTSQAVLRFEYDLGYPNCVNIPNKLLEREGRHISKPIIVSVLHVLFTTIPLDSSRLDKRILLLDNDDQQS